MATAERRARVPPQCRVGLALSYPLFLAPLLLVTASAFTADAPKLPSIPAEPIAKKKELLFSDDFERAVSDTMRATIDGKPVKVWEVGNMEARADFLPRRLSPLLPILRIDKSCGLLSLGTLL